MQKQIEIIPKIPFDFVGRLRSDLKVCFGAQTVDKDTCETVTDQRKYSGCIL